MTGMLHTLTNRGLSKESVSFVVFLPLHSGDILDKLSDLILLPVTQVMLPSIEIGSTSFDMENETI
jgi:hypothetical protein